MSRQSRVDVGDQIYHVINRSNGRVNIFDTEIDYKDFEYLLFEMKETFNMRMLAYVIMPNHWHLLLYPRKDKDLSRALQWLGTSHAGRHHSRKGTVGYGHLYQGRYKSFIVDTDKHYLTVLKYIERNPVRGKLVNRAEEWRWGSAHERTFKPSPENRILEDSPVDLPREYTSWVNYPEQAEELKSMRHSVNTGVKYIGSNLEL